MRRVLAALCLSGLGAGCVASSLEGEVAELVDARVEFHGVKALQEAELRRTVRADLDRYFVFPERGVLDDAAFRLLRRYRLEGYARAEVTAEDEGERVLFGVVEGPRMLLGRLHFEGNRAFSDEELRQVRPAGMLGTGVIYSDLVVAHFRDAILLGYGERGYVEALIGAPEIRFEGDRAHLRFFIEEGPMYRLAGIEGLPDEDPIRRRFHPRIGLPYTPDLVPQLEGTLMDRLQDGGHPSGRVRVRAVLDRDAAEARLHVEIVPGPSAVLGELRVSGLERTQEGFVRNRAGLETGEPYRSSRLREAERRLLTTGLFLSVRALPAALQEEEGVLPIDLELEEREPGEVSVRGGYGTLEGIRVGADFSYHNLLGGGELFRLGGTGGRFGWRAEAEAALPYVMGSDYRPSLTGFYESRTYPSFDVVSHGGAVSLTRQILEGVNATLGWRLAQIRTVEVDPSVPPGDLLDFSYTAPFAALHLDLRDSALLPTRGMTFSVQGEWSAAAFGSDIEFVNLNGKITGYLPLPGNLVLAGGFQGGRMAPLRDTQDIPISLRYFAGGTNSVRGFKFASIGPEVGGEPVGGEVYLALQTEIRFPLWEALHGALFWDEGGVWFKRQDVDLSDLRHATGGGLRYYTPAGAIVVDVAWNRRRLGGEDAVQVHLSIGFPF
jgi:outer membrane protein assembly complex protein YaeT